MWITRPRASLYIDVSLSAIARPNSERGRGGGVWRNGRDKAINKARCYLGHFLYISLYKRQ